jgi:twitching motility protein PilT
MEQALAHYVKAGAISFEIAASKSSKPEEMQRIIAGAGTAPAMGARVGAKPVR